MSNRWVSVVAGHLVPLSALVFDNSLLSSICACLAVENLRHRDSSALGIGEEAGSLDILLPWCQRVYRSKQARDMMV